MKVQTVYVEITNQCNLNCCTCYNRSGLNRKREEISIPQLEDIIKIFRPYGMNRLLISGGEPTLHSNFDGVLGLWEQHPELSFGLVTNGTNHLPRLISYLNTHNNISLQISLDGSCEAQNAKTRGSGHFDNSVAFVQQIHNPSLKPLLKMVVSQKNLEDVEPYYRFALSLGCIPEFAFIYRSGNGSDAWNNKALTPQQKMKVLNTIKRLNAELDTQAFLPLCTITCPFVTTANQMSLCIKTNGNIHPCQSLYTDEFSLGNVFSFNPAVFESNVRRIMAIAQQREQTDYNCSQCLIRDFCGKGCMAAAVCLHGDPLANDEECKLRKLQFLYHNIPHFIQKGVTDNERRKDT